MKRLSFLILLIASTGVFAAYPDEYPKYLRMLGFTKDDIRNLREEGFIGERLRDVRPGEDGVSAATVLDIPGYFVRDYYSYIENFRNLLDFQEVGKFKLEPDLRDLAPLSFSPVELQTLAGCATNCNLNLTEQEIAGIQNNTDLEHYYRNLFLDRLLQFKREGSANQTYLQDFPHLKAYFPNVIQYSENYPSTRDRRIPEFFYWIKQKHRNASVIQLRHVFTHRLNKDFVIVDELVYSNQIVIASAFTIHLIDYADGGHPRTLMVFHGRTYADPELSRPAGLDQRFFNTFQIIGQELENRYLNREYPAFPYGMVATDQR